MQGVVIAVCRDASHGVSKPVVEISTTGGVDRLGIQPGLMAATLERDADGGLVRKSGGMGTVVAGGEVRAGDPISVRLPAGPHRRLDVVCLPQVPAAIRNAARFVAPMLPARSRGVARSR